LRLSYCSRSPSAQLQYIFEILIAVFENSARIPHHFFD
jgi:hypothetical protein